MTRLDRLPYVLFQVKNGLYAVGAENVREILILPKVVSLPNTPPEVRGVIKIRERVMKLIDLRVKLNFSSAQSELDNLVQLLQDREQDHRIWLAELEACVRERRPFNLPRDHHKCKFGLWYDNYRTEDSMLRMVLKKMDDPHRIIHSTANEVLALADKGETEQAIQLLADRRDHELAAMVKLFEESRRILREHYRELALILTKGNSTFAMSIDNVEAVEHIPQDKIEPMPVTLVPNDGKFACRVGKRGRTNETILILDDAFLFTASAAAVA